MMRSTWLVLVLATTTCHCESGPTAVPAPSPAPTSSDRAELRAHMRAHFEAAGEMQRAIAHGRLSEARDLAAWLGRHYMEELDGWQPYTEEMQIAAKGIEAASDVTAAGAQLGRLGRACSSCHEARGIQVAFPLTPAPSEGPGLELQMRRHQWAAARLWEGVIGPSDASWASGAQMMSTTPFDVMITAHEKPNAEVVELAEQLRARATAAVGIRDRDVRATAYGEMMATCAGCHAVVRIQPVVDARP
jgi:cytochrome c556